MYDKKFDEKIKKLKALQKTKPEAYKELFKEIELTYGISDKTIYRKMKRKNPAKRKKRSNAGKEVNPVKAKEKNIAAELLQSGTTQKEAGKIIEMKTGKKVSTRKLAKIVSEAKTVTPDKPTVFGKNIQDFLERYFELIYWSEDRTKPIKLGTFKFEISKEDVNDIVRILTNAYNLYAEANGKKLLALDRLELLKSQIYSQFAYSVRVNQDIGSEKTLKLLVEMLDKLKPERIELKGDFETINKVLTELDPTLTLDQKIALIRKHS